MVRDVHHLVGAQEIAQMLGVSRQRVQQLVARPDFPPAAVVLAMGKVWHTDDVIEWAEATGRTLN
jgi:predicted DNA-binding transcriptional regulator AlpA